MEKQLSGGEELRKIMCKRYPDYPDISSKEFFELIEICFQEGRQSKLKEVLNILERYDYLNNGFIIEIKEQISKELAGVKK